MQYKQDFFIELKESIESLSESFERVQEEHSILKSEAYETSSIFEDAIFNDFKPFWAGKGDNEYIIQQEGVKNSTINFSEDDIIQFIEEKYDVSYASIDKPIQKAEIIIENFQQDIEERLSYLNNEKLFSFEVELLKSELFMIPSGHYFEPFHKKSESISRLLDEDMPFSYPSYQRVLDNITSETNKLDSSYRFFSLVDTLLALEKAKLSPIKDVLENNSWNYDRWLIQIIMEQFQPNLQSIESTKSIDILEQLVELLKTHFYNVGLEGLEVDPLGHGHLHGRGAYLINRANILVKAYLFDEKGQKQNYFFDSIARDIEYYGRKNKYSDIIYYIYDNNRSLENTAELEKSIRDLTIDGFSIHACARPFTFK